MTLKLDKLVQRCIDRHRKPLQQIQTRSHQGRYSVAYSAAKTIDPEQLSRVGIGFMPITKSGHCPELYSVKAGKDWQTTYSVSDWKAESWRDSYGIQIYTGKPSKYITDLDLEYAIIRDYPEVFKSTLERLIALTEKPLIVISKSGGLRFVCRTPCYVHSKSDQRYVATWKNHHEHEHLYLEIFGDKGLSRYDARYEIIAGSLLDIPVVDHHVLFEIIDELREQIGEPRPEKPTSKPTRKSPKREQVPDAPSVKIVDRLPEDIAWRERKDGSFESIRGDYPCQVTKHKKSHGAAQYYRQTDGQIDAFCHNCQQPWIVKKPTTVEKLIAKAPLVEIHEKPSFPYFSEEECAVVDKVLGISPNAGWHSQTPVWTPKYEYLHPLTNKFALNGQPSEVEKRRVWSTLFGNCKLCGAVTAQWVDRYLLTAGLYCDGCHKDYRLGSYLELELARKLPNSIVSDYQGFLGDDLEFADFRLWQPGTLTHLGAGMSTGKSTEIYRQMIALATQGLGKGIIAVPRVSLARFLAHYLRQQHGSQSWGLWHEGSGKSNQFIGEFGAIVCLPSLPRSVKWASDAGVERLYIAIDELDFAYSLLSLSIEQATAVKKCLRDALASTGLVVSGQTESTLALEAFAAELECDQVQAFYNTAKPSEGCVILHKHANIDGKSNAVLCGVIDEVSDVLSTGQNGYVFCHSRRDADIIAEQFADENLVIYNAYTKGDERADAVLKAQRLTDDARLFIGTSAAGVGISILDPDARTIITSGLIYGSRDANMMAQMAVRDRGRRGVSIHYTDYDFRLPIKPTENEAVSLYHEALKISENRRAHLSEAGVKKIAHAEALSSLADTQIEAFIFHHLGVVGNMPVYQASALTPEPEHITLISESRKDLRRTEHKKKLAGAITILKSRDLLTASEIRVQSNKGEMSADLRLAHECANSYASAVGWNDKVDQQSKEPFDGVLDDTDITVATALAKNNINTDRLEKQRRGYLAVNFPKWTSHMFEGALAKAEIELVNEGLGVEITSISDDRFLGELLKTLLQRLTGEVFNLTSLATAVQAVLKQKGKNGKSFWDEIHCGALGASEYRKARFLHCADNAGIVNWVSQFIAEWYPARIQKRGDYYGLTHAENLKLRLKSFLRWLIHQPGVPDGIKIDLKIFQPTELPGPNAELKVIVRSRRKAGESISQIAADLNRNRKTVSRWCQGIKPPSPVEIEVLNLLNDGKVWRSSEIEHRSRFARRNIVSAIQKLLDSGAIRRIKRGYYQK